LQAPGKKILFLQFQPVAGYPPLMNLMRCCSARAETHVINLHVSQHALLLPPDLQRLVLKSRPGGSGRLSRFLARIVYAATALSTVCTGSYHVIVVTDANAAWLGWLVRSVFSGNLVYIEYDTTAAGSWRRALMQAARNRLARVADMVLVPNRTRLKALVQESGRTGPTARLANYPTLLEVVTGALPELSGDGKDLRLYYHGTLVSERLPEALFAAIAARKNVSLTIRGLRTIPENGYFDKLTALIRSYQIESQVRLLAPLPADELRDEAASHHAGIAFFSSSSPDVNLRTMWGASNKVYQYMAYGLLVLFSSAEEEMVSNMEGLGLRCDMADPDSITAAFDYICRHPDDIRTMRERSRRMIADEWNFEAEFRTAFAPLLP
jgi:glycosyltransferase involved in cell wall biosynthesis